MARIWSEDIKDSAVISMKVKLNIQSWAFLIISYQNIENFT